jgi:DNA processing protein
MQPQSLSIERRFAPHLAPVSDNSMELISSVTKKLLTLSMIPGIGPARLRKLLSEPQFLEMDIEELARIMPTLTRAMEKDNAWRTASEAAEYQIHEAEKHASRIISVLDPAYPRLLENTKDDPLLLYVRGALAPNPEHAVAIIGTREPTPHGERIATKITEFFVESGWSIVSGLAKGCDTIAHQTALRTGGHTVAVLAHGLQMTYPAANRKLAESILESGGALVSEYPFGREVQKTQFVKRDRTQAGLARGVVMIQSDLVGGSLHASRAALDYDRWLAVPYPTEKDRERNEPKIQANLKIAEGSDFERAQLLNCEVPALRKVFILWSREDYHSIINANHNMRWAQEPNNSEASDLFGTPDGPTTLIADANLAEKIVENPSENLHIQPVPSAKEASPFWLELSATEPDIAAATAARVHYLSTKLATVNSAKGDWTLDASIPARGKYALALEDFFYHLEQTVELLLAVEQTVFRSELLKENSDRRENGEELQKFAGDPVLSMSQDMFAQTVMALRSASTQRLIAALGSDRETIEVQLETLKVDTVASEGETTTTELIELCSSFNKLIRRVLYKS